ncbi:integrase catalytic domain-containing protein [Trichonephila clavipes]|nr:integrase catalytic domain-containing protein [Trichonephila clavipes]
MSLQKRKGTVDYMNGVAATSRKIIATTTFGVKSYNELSDKYPLAKQHFQNLWRRFGHDSELYQQYREIIRDYTEQGIIEEKKENFNVHPVHETVSLGANGTKVLGLSWNTNEDYLTTDTKSLLEFVSLDKNTKRFILQAVGKIFEPLGLISPFTVRMKCLLQDLWKEEIQWDDPLPTHMEKEWKKWCEDLPHLRNLKVPRLVLDSTLLEHDVELHSFCDASKKAYGAAIYLRTKSRNGISVKLVTSKSRVAPLNCVTLPRLELLGALVAARLASKVKKIVNLKRSCLQYHWTDSKIVLFLIKGNKTRWKQFVANRVNEMTSLTDPHSWYHCVGKENPADFLSRGLSADCLVSNSRWWTGAEFLSDSEFPKNFQQVVPELDYLTEHEKETVVQERKKLPESDRSEETVLLNSDSSSILDELLELSNNYFKVINILSYIFRFNYNCRNKSKKVGPLIVAEFKESEIKLIKHAQRSLFDKKEIPSCISISICRWGRNSSRRWKIRKCFCAISP